MAGDLFISGSRNGASRIAGIQTTLVADGKLKGSLEIRNILNLVGDVTALYDLPVVAGHSYISNRPMRKKKGLNGLFTASLQH